MFDLPPNSKKVELLCLNADDMEVFVAKIIEKIRKENLIEGNPYLTTKEACDLLKCKEATLAKYWKEGHIARAKLSGGHILYDRESIQAFIKKHTHKFDDGSK
ncbi:MAG: helix-turn-helix domain-containing protein [Cyanothece sp. SIO1E1]|nr:helix-turn-helix domain-containing protein [Cyanothece sp. SIO1E1]